MALWSFLEAGGALGPLSYSEACLPSARAVGSGRGLSCLCCGPFLVGTLLPGRMNTHGQPPAGMGCLDRAFGLGTVE